MEQNSKLINALRTWFLQCPLLQDEGDVLVDTLSVDATECAIFCEPSEMQYAQYFGGLVQSPWQTRGFVLASRRPYSEQVVQNLQNIGFFDGVQDWIKEQNAQKNFPEISGARVKDVQVKNTAYLMQAQAGDAVYQIQCSVTYREDV